MPPIRTVLSNRIHRIAELTCLILSARRVSGASHPGPDGSPVLFFNATTRLSGLSQNAGFSLLASWVVPANLIQAQRDYFGAHTYERIDTPGTFHTDWAKG